MDGAETSCRSEQSAGLNVLNVNLARLVMCCGEIVRSVHKCETDLRCEGPCWQDAGGAHSQDDVTPTWPGTMVSLPVLPALLRVNPASSLEMSS